MSSTVDPFLIKICGFTTAGDVSLALDLGVDLIGLILVPDTPRTVTATALQTIVAISQLHQGKLVGVFRNQPLALVNELARLLPLHAVQLHGEESPEYCQQVERPVIKVFSLLDPPDQATLRAYQPFIQQALYDWPKGQPGPIDWPSLKERLSPCLSPDMPPALLAGQLTAETVGAIIQQFQPAGVDVASGVESSPGVKDPDKLRVFVAACRASHRAIQPS